MTEDYDVVKLERDIKEKLEGHHDRVAELADLSETASDLLKQRLGEDYHVKEIVTLVSLENKRNYTLHISRKEGK